MRASECPPHKDTKRRAPRVLHRAEPETERRPGGWGASGAAALYCLKQDRDDMVPVGVVEKQALMLKPPLPTTHFRISPP